MYFNLCTSPHKRPYSRRPARVVTLQSAQVANNSLTKPRAPNIGKYWTHFLASPPRKCIQSRHLDCDKRHEILASRLIVSTIATTYAQVSAPVTVTSIYKIRNTAGGFSVWIVGAWLAENRIGLPQHAGMLLSRTDRFERGRNPRPAE